MKKLSIIVFFLLSASLTTFSQNMPKEGYTGFVFNVTGISSVAFSNAGQTILSGTELSDPLLILPSTFLESMVPQNVLTVKRYYANGLAGRLSLGINSASLKTTSADSSGFDLGFYTTDMSLSAFSAGLGIGVEKHISTTAQKVDPYVGADINLAYLGKINYSSVTDYADTISSYVSDYTVTYPGGFGFGVNLFAGFNYFFSDNIAIGAEAGIGFNSVSIGGEYESEYTYSPTPGTPTTTSDNGTIKNSSSGIGVGSTAGVNLSIYW